MPDLRSHRGPHPEDRILFDSSVWPVLQQATDDLSWLLTRRYAIDSSIKLVGDRYQLHQRQRLAIMRCACSEDARTRRLEVRRTASQLAGTRLLLDGYNVLISIEAALSNGVILKARDSCYRDLASMHGTYRKVLETRPALIMIGARLAEFQIGPCLWYLDSPVSNSGRLKTIMLELAAEHGWNWQVELVHNPDSILAESGEVIATADSMILDRCQHWLNLACDVIANRISDAFVVDLGHSGTG